MNSSRPDIHVLVRILGRVDEVTPQHILRNYNLKIIVITVVRTLSTEYRACLYSCKVVQLYTLNVNV